jgi:hypothetical protein
VFEAGLFGGALGIRRTFILHAHGSKLPSDLLGLTSIRYDPATSPAEVRAINQKLREAIEAEGRRGPVEGLWWQLSLTVRTDDEPSAVSLLRISRDPRRWPEPDGPRVAGGRHTVGPLLVRGCDRAPGSQQHLLLLEGRASPPPECPAARGHRRDQDGERADRATGYWTTRSDRDPGLNARTAGVYLRTDPSDLELLDSGSEEERAELIAQRLREWKSAANVF